MCLFLRVQILQIHITYKSTWSKVNKLKIEKLTETGRMTKWGMKAVEIAMENGSWTLLDEVESLIIPEDLQQKLYNIFGSAEPFLLLSRTIKKELLMSLVLSRSEKTRSKRIDELIETVKKMLVRQIHQTCNNEIKNRK